MMPLPGYLREKAYAFWRYLVGGIGGSSEIQEPQPKPEPMMSWNLDRTFESTKQHEGFSSTPYPDSLGHITIGYGRNLEAHPYTEAEAEAWTRGLLCKRSITAREYAGEAWRDMGPIRRETLIQMAYAMGPRRLNGFTELQKAIRQRDHEWAAREILDSEWARVVGKRPGQRAHVLAERMRTGVMEQ